MNIELYHRVNERLRKGLRDLDKAQTEVREATQCALNLLGIGVTPIEQETPPSMDIVSMTSHLLGLVQTRGGNGDLIPGCRLAQEKLAQIESNLRAEEDRVQCPRCGTKLLGPVCQSCNEAFDFCPTPGCDRPMVNGECAICRINTVGTPPIEQMLPTQWLPGDV